MFLLPLTPCVRVGKNWKMDNWTNNLKCEYTDERLGVVYNVMKWSNKGLEAFMQAAAVGPSGEAFTPAPLAHTDADKPSVR